jgi:hypothetical protein
LKGVLNGGYDYTKLNFSVSDDIKIPPLGTLYLNIFAGKYFGSLPYPLLEIHPGNETYYYNKYAFSMMNQFEFISDQYVGLNVEHSLGGGLFKLIPGVRKLKLRQFWTTKAVIGSLSDSNAALNLDKGYTFRTLEKSPYIEVGTGIENILKLFRVDFVWRLTPANLPISTTGQTPSSFGIFGSLIVGIIHSIAYDLDFSLLVITVAGIAGNLSDSLLGALFERKGLLGNNAVNFLNTAIGSGVAFLCMRLMIN